MAFQFNWGEFSPDFCEEAKEMLTTALNKEGGNKPPNIVGDIVVKELNLGKEPPDLEILEIGDLGEENFRAIFKMTYTGDGCLVLQTKVQANPLTTSKSDILGAPTLNIVAADQPLIVPMLLTISKLNLRGIIVLAVSKKSGITLVFKNDPLVSVEVHSTFDSLPSVRRNLQRDIEETLRVMFQEDLPTIVHEISVKQIRRQQEKQDQRRRSKISAEQAYLRNRAVSRSSGVTPAFVGHTRYLRPESNMDWSPTPSINGSEASTLGHPYHNNISTQLYSKLSEIHGQQQVASSTTGGTSNGNFSNNPFSSEPMNGFGSDDFWNGPGPHSNMSGRSDGSDCHTTVTDQCLASDRQDNELLRSGAMYSDNGSPPVSPRPEMTGNGFVLSPSDSQVAAELASLMAMGYTLYPFTRTFKHTTFRSNIYQQPFEGHQPLEPINQYSSTSSSADNSDPPLHQRRQTDDQITSGTSTPIRRSNILGRRRPLKRKVVRLSGFSAK
ncbi:ERMES complex subunit [Mycoemilia scoparia]|uniref:Mitochondrial distribution and morphology protein 34 n=1 Tax=Mycoemilia scoparia TaxID=417184 RepID=A0A9W7ZY42_9FUNG|nr:ERMES complex subunit [Mycoemilia scoparia]